jgi:hypothetical protein
LAGHRRLHGKRGSDNHSRTCSVKYLADAGNGVSESGRGKETKRRGELSTGANVVGPLGYDELYRLETVGP